MASGVATTAVRTARALFRGPLPATGAALCAGEISAAHAEVLATSTLHQANHAIQAAEPIGLDAARRLDPTGLGKAGTTTMDQMVAVRGILAPEAGQLVALEPLAHPADHHDTRSGGQRTADALEELARRQLDGGQLPKTVGSGPSSVSSSTCPASTVGVAGRAGWVGRWAGPGRWTRGGSAAGR